MPEAKDRAACLTCRTRKVACDRTRPKCSLCSRNGFTCEYVSAQRTPGLRAGYVAQLEQRLARLESRVARVEADHSSSCPSAPSDLRNSTLHSNRTPASPTTPTPEEANDGRGDISDDAMHDANTMSMSVVPDGQYSSSNLARRFGVGDSTPSPIGIGDFRGAGLNQANRLPSLASTTSLLPDLGLPAHSTLSPGIGAPEILFPTPTAAQTDRIHDNIMLTVSSELCGVWFEKYHPWFPLLHQASLLQSLPANNEVTDPLSLQKRDSGLAGLVIRAIVATTLCHQRSVPSTAEQTRRWAKDLRRSVLVDAMGVCSLRSIQALLIISLTDYGEGELTEFWSTLAICKRMGDRLGLESLVSVGLEQFNHHSAVLSRLLPLDKAVIEREERVRAYWMMEMLDSMSTLGTSWNLLNLAAPNPAVHYILPCSDSLWRFPERGISAWSLGRFRYSSALSLCITLVATELHSLHEFLGAPVDWSTTEKFLDWQSEAQRIDERLTSWREEFVAAVFRIINAELVHEDNTERAEMEPNIVLNNCLLNMAIIVLFQGVTQLPAGIDIN